MRDIFQELFEALSDGLRGTEVLTAEYAGEDSDFVRLNAGRVRQAGHVRQASVVLRLVQGQRHASAECNLSGERDHDRARLGALLEGLRERLPHLPEDPHLLLPPDVTTSDSVGQDLLPPAADAVQAVLDAGEGLDLVGIHAQGGIQRGFVSSRGQRHWFGVHSFATDFCLYHQADKAVKSTYAGFAWRDEDMVEHVAQARERLDVLRRPPKKVAPGEYRVYLAPAAVAEVLGLLTWDGFGLRAQRTRNSPLLRLLDGEQSLSPAVSLWEHPAGGLAPRFSEAGFPRPDRIPLIQEGKHAGALVSPRSSKEFGVPTNGADSEEAPTSLDMAGGDLPEAQVLDRLGEGIWISNLWYTNFSDRAACRITGMTRFATCWVEGGRLVAPLSVMRFDETLFRMLGTELEALTAKPAFLPSTDTYYHRSTDSVRVPGALVKGFAFTL